VGFLRRLLGGDHSKVDAAPATDTADADETEAAYERDLLREDQERLSALTRRQLRYAEYAWKPPTQGGERRADDPEEDVSPCADA
jgi:hypothetical protein